jgi:hypothetical protein
VRPPESFIPRWRFQSREDVRGISRRCVRKKNRKREDDEEEENMFEVDPHVGRVGGASGCGVWPFS